jgi:hypothetical protein
MNVEVNYLAVLLAALSSMVVGFVWYAKPVFGAMWMKLAKIDAGKMKPGSSIGPIVSTFVLSLLTAYVLAHVTYLAHVFFQNSFMQDALSTAFWVWLGFVMTRIMVHNMFEQKPGKLNLLAVGHEFVTIMLMGLIIGWLAPAAALPVI